MATNEKSIGIGIPVTVGTSEVSGNPVLVGASLVGVLEGNADPVTGAAILNVAANRVWSLSVKGVNDGGNSAVVFGDKLYIVMADTPRISKKATAGVLFGKALGAVPSGTTAVIDVQLVQA